MRHKWGSPIRPDAHNTMRICVHCDLRKITRHEPEPPYHWTEFYRADGARVYYGDGDTPPCGVMGKGLPAADLSLSEAMELSAARRDEIARQAKRDRDEGLAAACRLLACDMKVFVTANEFDGLQRCMHSDLHLSKKVELVRWLISWKALMGQTEGGDPVSTRLVGTSLCPPIEIVVTP